MNEAISDLVIGLIRLGAGGQRCKKCGIETVFSVSVTEISLFHHLSIYCVTQTKHSKCLIEGVDTIIMH